MSDRQMPKQYLKLQEKYPQFIEAVANLGRAVHDLGPLDDKTAELIQVAAGAVLKSHGAVHSHARRALDLGASPDELRHAVILLTSTIGFPNVSAALTWIDDIVAE